MGLFSKDPCVVCGEKTGLTDKKVVGGKICKSCAGKMSEWFDDYKTTPAEFFEVYLQMRKDNAAALRISEFPVVLGDFGAILINPERKEFVAINDLGEGLFETRKAITCLDDIIDLNPQIVRFDEVKDFDIDIVELSHEIKDAQGESYSPQQFDYGYMFYLEIHTSNPLAKLIRVQLNNDAVTIRSEGRRVWTDLGRKLAAHLLGLPGLVTEDLAAIYNNDNLIHLFYISKYEMPDMSYGFKCTRRNWDDLQKYQYYLFMSQTIQSLIHPED